MVQRLIPKLQLAAVLLAGAFLMLLLLAARQSSSEPAPPQPPAAPTLVAAASATRAPSPAASATPTPFPTAAPPEVQLFSGPLYPDGAASATTRLGELTFELLLERLTYVPGEAGRARLRLTNGSRREVLAVNVAQLVVLPRQTGSTDLARGSSAFLPDSTMLEPGETFTQTLVFQVPPADLAGRPELWAALRFQRLGVARESYHGRSIESGPIPLQLRPAPGERQLLPRLHVDEAGWQLWASALDGSETPRPVWGQLVLQSASAPPINILLPDSPTGSWSGTWSEHLRGPPHAVAALVAAPGAVAQVVTETLRSSPAIRRLRGADERAFSTLEDAEAAFSTRFARLTGLPPDTTIEAVVVFSRTFELRDSHDIQTFLSLEQRYRLANGGLLQLGHTQIVAGATFYDFAPLPEAQPIEWARSPGYSGYAVREFGSWHVRWGTLKHSLSLTEWNSGLDYPGLLAIVQSIEQ